MTNMTVLWVVVGVVVLLLIILGIIIAGKQRKKAKTVSFEKQVESAEPKQLTREEKSGNYQAKGGFNFAQADAAPKQPEPVRREPVAAPVEPQASGLAPHLEEQLAAEQAKQAEQVEQVEQAKQPEEPVVDVQAAVEQEEPKPFPEPESEAVVEPEPVSEPEPVVEEEPVVEPEPVVEEEPVVEPEPVDVEKHEALAAEAAAAAAVAADSAEEALAAEDVEVSEDAVVTPAPAAEAQIEQIEPAAGRIGKLRGRLSRSQNAIGQGLLGILTAGDLDEDAWEEIEDTLIMADLGAQLTMKVVDSLREKIAQRGVSSEAEARAMLRETLIEAARPDMDRSIKAMPNEGKPAVILVVGVNGTGKTTTTGKLARVLVSMGHTVVLGAADTFRAAAADQLETWGRRVGASTVRGKEGADPASVAFDAVATGVDQGADVVVVDTAGRLHTATGLMDQLGKVKRVVEKKSNVDEVLLVLDATVGQNGIAQARVFREVVDITGVVLTKLDGTAKGGIVFQVQEELGVPVKLVGLGEGADDLAPFEVESFVDALLG
ncbi:signal recognition particle-docking protein FtsY [Corynebacterium riegelii]|uniref:signal recognition particle-docking protein FtsY n=1 Tax=Corynebacterium riegelii TaxID=156976 RepID=UPI0023F6C1C6|nr:signal recognition particle-docking protein FtsY [Corynebacterium riegelii]